MKDHVCPRDRRGYLKRAVAATALLAAVSLPAPLRAEGVEVELVHWWTSPGEAHALDIFREEVERRGGIWKPITVSSYSDTKEVVSKRLQVGLPPTMTQWISGSDLKGLHKVNNLKPIPQSWRDTPLDSMLFGELWDAVQEDGKALAIPVGVHMQAYALHNAKAYSAIDRDPPRTWNEFLEIAPKLQGAGYVPIATSAEDWQTSTLFTTIIIDQGGLELHEAVHDDKRKLDDYEKPLADAFSVLRQLHDLALDPALPRKWTEVTEMVANGTAATMIMGDFAKGDMQAAGLEPGRDYLCTFAPGNHDIQLWAADVFVPLNTSTDSIDPGVELLMDIILDPAVQAEFARRKGALPVRRGISHDLMGPCEREIYASWEAGNNTLVPMVTVGDSVREAVIRNVVKEYWDNPELSPGEAANQFISFVNDTVID